jgi:hypothetical protein
MSALAAAQNPTRGAGMRIRGGAQRSQQRVAGRAGRTVEPDVVSSSVKQDGAAPPACPDVCVGVGELSRQAAGGGTASSRCRGVRQKAVLRPPAHGQLSKLRAATAVSGCNAFEHAATRATRICHGRTQGGAADGGARRGRWKWCRRAPCTFRGPLSRFLRGERSPLARPVERAEGYITQ